MFGPWAAKVIKIVHRTVRAGTKSALATIGGMTWKHMGWRSALALCNEC